MPDYTPFPGYRLPIVRKTIQQVFEFAFDAGVSVGAEFGLTIGIAIGAAAACLVWICAASAFIIVFIVATSRNQRCAPRPPESPRA